MAIFEGERLEEARSIIARYPQGRERSALMPLLYLAQSEQGRLTGEGLREVADLVGVRTAEVEAVATFYTMLRVRETGTHVVSVCTNLSCALRGAKDVFAAACQEAGVDPGAETSADGLFTVHEEECLGVCEKAPAVQVNSANHDAVSPERVRELVAELREGRVPEPARGPAVESFRHASRILAGLEALPAEGVGA